MTASARTLLVLFWTSVVFMGVFSSSTIQAQPDDPPPKREVVSVPLQDVDAEQMLQILSSLKLVGQEVAATTESRTNSLILAGNPDAIRELKKVVRELADRLSAVAETRRKGGREAAQQVRAFVLKHLKAGQAYQEVLRLNPLLQGQIATDPQRNRLLVRGDEESLDQVRALLEIIDLPARPADAPQNLQIRVVWLVSSGLIDHEGEAPPEDLSDIVAALKQKAGVGDLRKAAQVVVTVDATGSSFVANGTAELKLGRAGFDVSGHLTNRTEKAARVEVSLSAHLQSPHPEARRLASLQTGITARLGHPVVLGMTPIDSMESIFVVQLLE